MSQPVLYWCPTAGEVEQQPGGGFDVCCHAPELHEPILAIVYEAVRREVAKEISVRLGRCSERVTTDSRGLTRDEFWVSVGLARGYHLSSQIALEIGGEQ